MIMIPYEFWRDIDGYEGVYQISNFGRIKSIERGNRKEKILKPSPNTHGYLKVTLSRFNVKKDCIIHQYVATYFVENPYFLSQINHKDGDKRNNFYGNLEWCTQSENTKHAYNNRLILHRVGEGIINSKLTDDQICEIRKYRSDGLKLIDISKKFGVSISTISMICNRKIWTHIL